MEIGHKASTADLVTQYDTLSEELIIAGIRDAFPDDRILGEESGDQGAGDWLWLLDPIDGTTNFAYSIPFFCVSIACSLDGAARVGVVYDPLRDELFHTSAGGGAWLGERRLYVTSQSDLSLCVLGTGFPPAPEEGRQDDFHYFEAFGRDTRAIRRLGSAALHLAYVACGRLDGYWELGLGPWDWPAGGLLVEEAGGRIATVQVGEPTAPRSTSVAASNGLIHSQMLEILGWS